MKWSTEQQAELRALCFNGSTNKEMAVRFAVPIAEIHAQRSRLGITREKVAAAKGQPAKKQTELEHSVAAETPRKSCKTCKHYACYARGTDATVSDCPRYMDASDRQACYLRAHKHEFLEALRHAELGISQESYDRIAPLINELIPETGVIK